MILLKSRSMTLRQSDSVLSCTETFLQYLGCLAAFVIIVVAIAGPTLAATEKTTGQPNCVFELSTKSKDKQDKTVLTVFTFHCQVGNLPFTQDIWTFSNTLQPT